MVHFVLRVLAGRVIPFLAIAAIFPLAGLSAEPAPPEHRTQNILLVTLDGLRWQEVFFGAEPELLTKERGGVEDVSDLRKKFWRSTVEERRQALMPFLWGVVAKEGQLFGNQTQQSPAHVTNQMHFSYPGYNEILCGFADPKITSNDKIPNANVTVLEWLHRKPEFKGRVAAFTSWDCFPYIINATRSGIPVTSGQAPLAGVAETAEVHLLNRLIQEAPLYKEEQPDAFTFHAARLYLQAKKPRVLYLSFLETDSQGHRGRYDRLLVSAHKADAYLRELWELIQQLPEYQGKTTLIVTTDHGRGNPPEEWKSHSARIQGSDSIWLGVLGPDTPPLGERRDTAQVGQNQVAATLAALLGYDYCADEPRAGKPIADLLSRDK